MDSGSNTDDDDPVVAMADDMASGVVTQRELDKMKKRMSSEANKAIRERYRTLLGELQEKVEKVDQSGDAIQMTDVRDVILNANEVMMDVMRPREAALDGQVLKMCGELVKSTLENKKYHANEFHLSEYATKTIHFLEGEHATEIDFSDSAPWKRLGSRFNAISKRCDTFESLFAGIDHEKPKKERQARRKKDDEVGAKVMPSQVREPSNNEERQTEEVNRIFKLLKRRYKENGLRPICYYKFVINPQSFCYTIENIFHTSFLVHMLRARIFEGSDGLPYIMPREQKSQDGEDDRQPSQGVVQISMDEFKELVKLLKLKEPCIPPPQTSNKRSSVS